MSAARLPPWLGVLLVVLGSTFFAANHLAARIAFDHGASVPTGVLARAAGTAIVLLALMRLQRVPLAVPRPLLGQAILAGGLIAVQSYCLYSAVARIPVAIALLVFQTSPVLFVLLGWATGRDAPRATSLAAMLLALAGLAMVLDIGAGTLSAPSSELATGVAWAFGAAVAFAFVLYANANALKPLDGRVRTFVMTAVTAVAVLVAAGVAGGFRLPHDAIGWSGLGLLTGFYCFAMCVLFITLPRVAPSATVAMNIEPIALLGLGWIFLGQALTPLQVVGAFVTVGGIAWLALPRA